MSRSPSTPGQVDLPKPKFVIGNAELESDPRSAHSRDTSYVESPPITPRSLTFGNHLNPFATPTNPFSPPISTTSLLGDTPGPAHGSAQAYPFPDVTSRSGITSVATSAADLSRMSSSYFGSRPNTADFSSSVRLSTRSREAFASPRTRPLTMYNTPQPSSIAKPRERPKSTMLSAKPALEKPWLQSRDPFSRISYFLTYGVMLLGIAAGVIRCYTIWISVPLLKGNLCLVMDEEFDSPDGVFGDNGKFFREVDMSGFGNGEFEMTTASENNSYVLNGHLYITPTLTSDNIGEAAVLDGTVYNITGCTYNITQGLTYTQSSKQPSNASPIGFDSDFDATAYYDACSAVSNVTAHTIINPVQSARISTRRSASMKFGRVEVRAKIPNGDWLWPAIWMLPVDQTYGAWPLSGEIDIMEARGNDPSYPFQGRNYVRGSLNWGPTTFLNAVSKTFGWFSKRRGSFSEDFHTYMLEWDEEFVRISVDSRIHRMLNLKMTESFWKRGDFPGVVQNGSETIILTDPWVNGTQAAPFDQSFYLIMNVAVGGTNGWFPDGTEKPWLDGSATAMSDFWKLKDTWYPTWPQNAEDRSLVVDSVKMWEQC